MIVSKLERTKGDNDEGRQSKKPSPPNWDLKPSQESFQIPTDAQDRNHHLHRFTQRTKDTNIHETGTDTCALINTALRADVLPSCLLTSLGPTSRFGEDLSTTHLATQTARAPIHFNAFRPDHP